MNFVVTLLSVKLSFIHQDTFHGQDITEHLIQLCVYVLINYHLQNIRPTKLLYIVYIYHMDTNFCWVQLSLIL